MDGDDEVLGFMAGRFHDDFLPQLNPVPAFFVARVAPGLVTGFISGIWYDMDEDDN